MIVLRRAHSLCETEVAPRFIPSLMIFISSGTFLREQPVKVRVCTKFWKLSQQMKEKKEKTLRLARGGKDMSNKKGRFGIHGGQYIPETLMNAVMELEEAYNHYKNDPQFQTELTELLMSMQAVQAACIMRRR